MVTLTKYFCKEFLKLFFFCHVIFLVIYLTVDFIQKVDDLIEAHASAGAIFGYFLYKVPYVTTQLVPVAALLSVIIMFSIMKKDNEIVALKACGVSVFRFSMPVIMAALGLAVLVFVFSETVVPYASTKSQEIWATEVKKKGQERIYGRGHIWYKAENGIYWIRHFDGENLVMTAPTFYFFDDSFHLVKRVQAWKAFWEKDRWILKDGVEQKAGKAGDYVIRTFKEMDLVLPERPDVFLRPAKRPEEMSYGQLKRFAEDIRLEGYNPRKYMVELNLKLAFPLITLIMVMIGIPISLGIKRGGTPLAVSLGIGLCFCYLVTLGLSRSLGFSGTLPPGFSAWLANIVFFLFALYMMMRVET